MSPRSLRHTRALWKACGLALALACAVVLWLCHTAPGREQVRDLVRAELDALLAGTFEVGELASLGFSGVELRRVRVRDPRGYTVLRVERATGSWSLPALWRGELVFTAIAVEGAFVDLAQLDGERGLVAAFTPRSRTPSSGAISVRLEAIAITRGELALELGATPLVLRDVTLHGSVGVDEVIRVELADARAQVQHTGTQLGAIQTLRGRYDSAGPSQLALGATLAESSLTLTAGLGRALDPLDAPLTLDLSLDAVDQALLARLGLPELATSLRQPVVLTGQATGSLREPRAALALAAQAGDARLTAELSADLRLALTLHTALLPAALWEGLPDLPLTATLGGQAELSDLSQVPLSFELSEGTLGDVALPRVAGSARLADRTLRAIALTAEGYGGRLALTGEADLRAVRGELSLQFPTLDGLPTAVRRGARLGERGKLEFTSRFVLEDGRVDAQGTLLLRALALEGLALTSLDGAFHVSGALAAPAIDATLQLGGLAHPWLRVDDARLGVQGGPADYQARLTARGPDLQLAAVATLARRTDVADLSLSSRGQLRGQAFALALARTRFADGWVQLGDAQLQLGGQTLRARGGFGHDTARQLVVTANALELAPLAGLFGLDPRLRGRVSFEAQADGPLVAPRLALTLTAQGLGLTDREPLDAELTASLAAQGRAEFLLAARSGELLALSLAGTAELPARPQVSWAQRLTEAPLDARLTLGTLDGRLLDAWLAPDPGLPGRVQGVVLWQGPLEEPRLEASFEARGLLPDSQRDLVLEADARYALGAADLRASLRDRDGPWLDLRAALAHPASRTASFLRDLAVLPNEGRYQAELRAADRTLGRLLPDLPDDQARIVLGAELSLAHDPREEPRATLRARLSHPERAGGPEACQGRQSELAASAQLDGGQLSMTLGLLREQRSLVALTGEAALALAPALQRTGPVRLSGLRVGGELGEVELASLPFLCGVVQGRLRGTLRGERLLSRTPEIALDLRARAFRLSDAPDTLDLTGQLAVHGNEASLALDVHGGAAKSRLTARLPLVLGEGAPRLHEQAPIALQARLDHLPLAPLCPRPFVLSRVSGSLSADVNVSGSLSAPHVAGFVAPHGVGFTVASLAQPLADLDGRLVFGRGQLVVERLSARDGAGTLSLQGQAHLPAGGPVDGTFALTARDFPVRVQGQVAGEVDARARVGVQLGGAVNRLDVLLRDVSVWLAHAGLRGGIDLASHPDIVDPRVPVMAETASEQTVFAVPLHATVASENPFWVTRDDFSVRVGTRLAVTVDRAGPRVEGDVQLSRGTLQFLGKTFQLRDASHIRFTGASPPDPALDIAAATQNHRTGQEVAVQIGGHYSAPKLTFLVDAREVTAGEAARAVVSTRTGMLQAAAQAQSFVGGLTGGLLHASKRRDLGGVMPMLTVEQSEDGTGSTLHAGFELDQLVPARLRRVIRGVYVEGMFGSGPEGSDHDAEGSVLLELYLPKDLVTAGQYGPGATWTLDFGWEP